MRRFRAGARRRQGSGAPPLSRRAFLLFGAQLAVVGGLAWRMRQLQIEEGALYRTLAEENRINVRLLAPARGEIFDRNGQPLAVNRQNFRVVVVREQAGDVQATLDRVGQVIALSEGDRERALREFAQKSAFVPVTVAEHLDWNSFARINANAPSLPGVAPEVGLTRWYPDAEAFAHVIGHVGPVSEAELTEAGADDPLLQIPDFQIGKNGVERVEEGRLRGGAGAQRIEVNAVGRVIREIDRTEAKPGADITLTIDRDLQRFAMERMGGESAAAVVIDVQSGDILCLASSPGFDPNQFVVGIGRTAWKALLDNDHRPLANKAVSGQYPPGSTFKMIVGMAALEAGVIGPNETVFCNGGMQLGDRRFHCWKRGGHGHMKCRDALKHSCDVYFYEAARRVGIDAIAEMGRRFGLGVRLDLPITAIRDGLMPTRDWKRASYNEGWQVGDTLNSGIGQGFVLATPLQLATMTARIARGAAVAPRLVRAIDGEAQPDAEAPSLGLRPATLALIREGMNAVVNEQGGTAGRARIFDPDIDLAGKTGTSQVRRITVAERARGVTRNENLPWERRDHALFVAYAPVASPRYAVSVIVEHGGGGSVVASPIARDIMLQALYGPEPPLIAYPPAERNAIEERRKGPPEAAEPAPDGVRSRA